jgi:hypothetical protein
MVCKTGARARQCGARGDMHGQEWQELVAREEIGHLNSQHGTGVEGSLQPCTEGHHPKQDLFHLLNFSYHSLRVYMLNSTECIASLPQVKNKPHIRV